MTDHQFDDLARIAAFADDNRFDDPADVGDPFGVRDPLDTRDAGFDVGHPASAGWSGREGHRPRITHLVLVDGLPADHWVDDSGDGSWSHPGQHGLPPRGRRLTHPNVFDPPHVRELQWLDCLVGGREALMALDDAPLVAPATVGLSPGLSDQAARVEALREACARHASAVFHDPEMPAATHHTLEAVLRADPAALTRSERDDTAVGAILWVAGHANGRIGPVGDILARELWTRIGVSSSAASRGATMLQRLRTADPGVGSTAWPDSLAPPGAPRLRPTGHAGLLTSSTRAQLILRRDAALKAARH
jgi:hypothetical protein